MIPRQVFYLSNLSCPVCGGVTVQLSWNLDIIRYEFCLYRNTVSLYFGIQDVPLGLNPRSKKQQISWNLTKFQAIQLIQTIFISIFCIDVTLLKGSSYVNQNIHWKLGQQTPSVGTLLAYVETTA